jgi:hypothetical protein
MPNQVLHRVHGDARVSIVVEDTRDAGFPAIMSCIAISRSVLIERMGGGQDGHVWHLFPELSMDVAIRAERVIVHGCDAGHGDDDGVARPMKRCP